MQFYFHSQLYKITLYRYCLLFHKLAVVHNVTGMDFVLYFIQTYLEFSVGSFGSVVKVESVVKEVFVYPRSKSQNRGLVTRSPVNCSPKVKPCYTKLNL